MSRRNKLSLWHPGARRFRTRVLRYLEARLDALHDIGNKSDYVTGLERATASIRSEIERMR